MTTTAIANGNNEVERKAAEDANAIQDGCNLVAIVAGTDTCSPCTVPESVATI